MKRLLLSSLLFVSLSMFVSSCGSDGGGDSPDGNSTVSGRVSGFAGEINVQGTSLRTNVIDGQPFVFSGVPEGNRTFLFTTAEGDVSSFQLKVPPNAAINVGTVKMAGEQAVPQFVDITLLDPAGDS